MRVVLTALFFAAGVYVGLHWNGEDAQLEGLIQDLEIVINDTVNGL